jgi:hypothetical protein
MMISRIYFAIFLSYNFSARLYSKIPIKAILVPKLQVISEKDCSKASYLNPPCK